MMAQRSKIQTRSVGERNHKGSFPSVEPSSLNSTGHVTVLPNKIASVSNRPAANQSQHNYFSLHSHNLKQANPSLRQTLGSNQFARQIPTKKQTQRMPDAQYNFYGKPGTASSMLNDSAELIPNGAFGAKKQGNLGGPVGRKSPTGQYQSRYGATNT